MSWEYPGQSSIVVPSSYLYFPAYVSNSLFNVTVTCPPYYTQTVSGSTPQCVNLWGNSKRDSAEECDDGNATSDDGWSATWDVENGYTCTGGSSTTVDICSKFTFVVSSSTTTSTTTSTSSIPATATTSNPSKPLVYTVSSSNRWVAKWVCSISACRNTKNWMCIGFYIRYLLLGYLLILVSSVNEISNYSVSNRRWSWSLTVAILLMWIVFFSIWLIKWLYATNDEEQTSDIFHEFVSIVKTNANSKMYSCLFMLHRILICATTWVDNSLSTGMKLILLTCIQGTYLVLLILIRPFCLIRANISKIVCESSVFVIIVLMYVYQSSSDWTNSTENVFMYIMMASSSMPFFMTTGNFLNHCIVSLLFNIANLKQNKNEASSVTPVRINIKCLDWVLCKSS